MQIHVWCSVETPNSLVKVTIGPICFSIKMDGCIPIHTASTSPLNRTHSKQLWPNNKDMLKFMCICTCFVCGGGGGGVGVWVWGWGCGGWGWGCLWRHGVGSLLFSICYLLVCYNVISCIYIHKYLDICMSKYEIYRYVHIYVCH